MTIQNEQIQKVMQVLTEWNPLGPRASTISDLNNYRTEAIDILFNLNLNKNNPAVIVQQVINQAFDLSLSVADCARVGRKIQELIKKQETF
jgi:ribosome maturation factor RimP